MHEKIDMLSNDSQLYNR